MKVLVLGADGFVGRKVVAALDASGWAVPVAGSRRAARARSGAAVLVDATDRASLGRALAGCDAVVNCVTGSPGTIEANAAALAAVVGARRLVHLSSMAVYGAASGLVDEQAMLAAGPGGYAAAKVASERLAESSGAVILRPGCIYGAGSVAWSLRIAALLRHRRVGDLGVHGDGCSNVVHVDDVVAAVLAGLRSETRGAFNLAMPDAPDWNGYFLAFARALGSVPIRRVPAWQLRAETLAAPPLQLAQRVGIQAPPPIPRWLLALWAQDLTIDPRRASRELGIAWTPLGRGLAEAAQWCASRLSPNSRP